MIADPYNLDQSGFARFLELEREALRQDSDDLPNEPPHPLRSDPAVSVLCDYLHQAKEELYRERKPNGGMGEDAYFQFNEGLMLRPEVVARLVIDYCRQHPEIVAQP